MKLSAAEARALAVTAQGLAGPRETKPDRRALRALVDQLGVVQIDSVNVLVRSHYLPAFSRLGVYDTKHLDEAAWVPRRRALFEYWARQASLLPLDLFPLFHWRMARARRGEGRHTSLSRFAEERRGFVDGVLQEIRDRGPLAASELTGGGSAKGKWWGWSDGKYAVEYLFWTGQLTVAYRQKAFERVYDLTERVLPAALLSGPHPDEAEAQRSLLRVAAGALGVATETELRGYFQLGQEARPRVRELVDAGELLSVAVEGWKQPAYLDARARLPRRVEARALLSPFDPLLYERDRAERIFGFRYRIGLYTPRDQRLHGYYVLPLLLGEGIAARLDLKADRGEGVLRVLAAHAEPGTDHAELVAAAAQTLAEVARWQGLEGIDVSGRGNLAQALRKG